MFVDCKKLCWYYGRTLCWIYEETKIAVPVWAVPSGRSVRYKTYPGICVFLVSFRWISVINAMSILLMSTVNFLQSNEIQSNIAFFKFEWTDS